MRMKGDMSKSEWKTKLQMYLHTNRWHHKLENDNFAVRTPQFQKYFEIQKP